MMEATGVDPREIVVARSFSAQPGAVKSVGRCRTRPIAAVISVLVSGSGALMFTAPASSSWSSTNRTART